MNTITKVIATSWVTGAALRRAIEDAETRYVETSAAWDHARRWVYASTGRQLSSSDLFGPIVIEVEAQS